MKLHRFLRLPYDVAVWLFPFRYMVYNPYRSYCQGCPTTIWKGRYCKGCIEKIGVPKLFICETCLDNLSDSEKHLSIYPASDLGCYWTQRNDKILHGEKEWKEYECCECTTDFFHSENYTC